MTEQDNTEPVEDTEIKQVEEQTEPEQDVEETFPREYVEKLRDENAKYRQRAQRADDLAQQVHRLLVEQTGRLADPEDLPYAEENVDNEEALTEAIDDLLERKPHLASRRPRGDVGQGVTGQEPTDLAAILRRAAN